MDQHGESHLAVIGIERDTKDGHYNYSAVRTTPAAHGLAYSRTPRMGTATSARYATHPAQHMDRPAGQMMFGPPAEDGLLVQEVTLT